MNADFFSSVVHQRLYIKHACYYESASLEITSRRLTCRGTYGILESGRMVVAIQHHFCRALGMTVCYSNIFKRDYGIKEEERGKL